MPNAARLDLASRRNEARVLLIRFRGVDWSASSFRQQVRVAADTPGAAVLTLGAAANGNAEGFSLVGVTNEGGVPVTTVRLRYNMTTMRDLVPYLGAIGDDDPFVHAIQVDGTTRLYGLWWAVASAIDSDAAPSDRDGASMTGSSPSVAAGVTVQVGATEVISVTIDGADQIGPLVAQATGAAGSAQADATRAETASLMAQFYSLPVYDTKAAATAALAGLADQAKVGIEADESQGGVRTVYRKTGGALALVANLSTIIKPLTITFQTAPVDANGGGSQVLWRRPSPKADGWGDVTSSTSASVITDPQGTYADNVLALFGYNMTVSFGQRDTSKPTTTLRCEERYRGANTGYKVACEFHFTTTPPGSATEIRWFSAYGTHLAADWNSSSWSLQFANLNWFAPFGNSVIEQWTPNGGDAAANGYQKAIVRKSVTLFENNNYAHTIQSTHDGAGTVPAAFLNARDEEQHGANQYFGAQPRTNVYGDRSVATATVDTPIDGDAYDDIRSTAPVSGTLYGRKVAMDADTLANRTANAKAGGEVVEWLSTASGDAYTRYDAPSHEISAGMRYSDSRYAIARGSSLSDEMFGIDRATGRASFAGALSKAIFTVAVLPNPTSIPMGTEAYCSDEIGGGVPVFTDGTNWRRATDRVVAS
jgi:hypothetical protein